MSDSGIKYDNQKPMFDLIDPYFLEDLAKVMTAGAQKYDRENWRLGLEVNRVLASLERHLIEIKKGVDIDSESGVSHLAHIAANAMFLHFYLRTRPDLDNRFYKQKRETK